MLGLSIKLNGNILTPNAYGITSGSERAFTGIVEKSEEWDKYTISILFKQGSEPTPVAVIDNLLDIPTHKLTTGPCDVYAVGTNGDETIISKTSSIYIYDGTVEGVEIPSDIWTKYVEIMNNHLQSAIAINHDVEEMLSQFREECEEQLNILNDKTEQFNTISGGKIEIITNYDMHAEDKIEEYNENATEKTVDFNENATKKSQELSDILDAVTQIKIETEGFKDETEILNEEVETNTITVEECRDIVTKAMHDLLSLMNDKIATLVDGKLNPDQIPDIAIGDVTWVPDEEYLVNMNDKQVGDIVYTTAPGEGADGDIVDAYINVGDSSENKWRKISASFTANAGHANTASTSINAMMINGKRIVSMTAMEYASAVKDEEVYYMVGGYEPEANSVKLTRNMYDAMTSKNDNITYVVTEDL